jgi:hypothetical protein
MKIHYAKTMTIHFTELSHQLVDSIGRHYATITEVDLSWTSVGDRFFSQGGSFDYEIRGWAADADGFRSREQVSLAGLSFQVALEQWEFLTALSHRIDHPDIEAAVAEALAKAIRETI